MDEDAGVNTGAVPQRRAYPSDAGFLTVRIDQSTYCTCCGGIVHDGGLYSAIFTVQ